MPQRLPARAQSREEKGKTKLNFAFDLAGGAPIVRRYRIASGTAAITVPGGYVTEAVANGTGVVFGTTTTTTPAVGSFVDIAAAAGTTAPTNDTNALLSVLINPLAVYRLRMVYAAAGGTLVALVTGTDTSKTAHTNASTDALDPNATSMDEGASICIGGTNTGQMRKITSVAANAWTTIEGTVNTPVSGDQYMLVPWWPFDAAGDNINLTTDLTSARADIAVGTGADMNVIGLDVDFSSQVNARTFSYVVASFAGPKLLIA